MSAFTQSGGLLTLRSGLLNEREDTDFLEFSLNFLKFVIYLLDQLGAVESLHHQFGFDQSLACSDEVARRLLECQFVAEYLN